MSMREKQVPSSLSEGQLHVWGHIGVLHMPFFWSSQLPEFGVPPRLVIRTWEAHRASQSSKPYTLPSFPIYNIRGIFASCPQYF